MDADLTPILPPPLIHALRARSFSRLFQKTENPGNRGFGRVLRQRIKSMVEREPYLVQKAITIAYMGSYLVDHIVFAEKKASLLMDQRELSAAEEHHLWEKNYGRVVPQLAREHPHSEAILDMVKRLDRYSRLPEPVHRMRVRHWSRFHRMLQAGFLRGSGVLAGMNASGKINKILAGNRLARAKALSVCATASILADMECWIEHVEWNQAYAAIMTDIYTVICHHPEVLQQIVELEVSVAAQTNAA